MRKMSYRTEIEVMICVTMYNEDAVELTETLTKIGRNIKHLVRHPLTNSPTFSKYGDKVWQNIVTTIVSDGRQKMNKSTLRCLNDVGLMDEGR